MLPNNLTLAIDDETGGRKLEDQADDLADDLEKLYNVHTDGEIGSRKTSLATTLNLGAEYAFPLYDKLKFGLLYSKHLMICSVGRKHVYRPM